VDDIALARSIAASRLQGRKVVSENKPYIKGTNFSGIIDYTKNNFAEKLTSQNKKLYIYNTNIPSVGFY
jgi:hypothetical protein